MKKKLISSIMIFILLVTAPGISTVSANTGSTPSSWAVAEIEKAKDYGLITAKVLGNYQQSITREEFCELAVKLYEALSGTAAAVPEANRFTDTNNPEILKANALGIVNGVNAEQTLFDPKANVNREQIAVMFYRTLQAVDSSLIQGSYFITFRDGEQISNWALDAVGFMTGNHIITGIGNNLVSPQGPATREQGIALVKRTYEKFRDTVWSKLYIPPNILEPATTQASTPLNGYEIYQEIKPGERTAKVASNDVSVTVPAVNISESKILSVKKVTDIKPTDGLNLVQAYDIQLGNQTEFLSPVEIEISVSQSKAYGAFYYNTATGAWEDIPYTQAGRTVTIKTFHLSRFAVAEMKNEDYYDPMARVLYYSPDFFDLKGIDPSIMYRFSSDDMNKQAFDKGWEAAKKWFDIGGVGTGILDNMLPGFSTLNETIGKMGNVIAPIQLYFDIRNDKHKDAAAGAYEIALGKMVEKIAGEAAGISLLGISLINMSIKEFAQAAISSKESQYEKAYAYYYNKKNSLNRNIKIRDGKDWYDAFYKMVDTSTEYLNERINADIERYVRAIWDDPALLTAQGIIGQQGQSSTIIGGGAYLNDDLKEKLSNNYAAHLSGYLEVILNKVMDDYEWNERNKFKKAYGDQVVNELNREYTLQLQLNGSDVSGLDTGVIGASDSWKGVTDSGGNWKLKFTMLGYLRAGAPRKVTCTLRNGETLETEFNLENLNVTLGEKEMDIRISVDSTHIETGELVTFNLDMPNPYDYIIGWDFENHHLDGFTNTVHPSVGYGYNEPGTYNVQVNVYDRETKEVLAQESVAIHVAGDLIDAPVEALPPLPVPAPPSRYTRDGYDFAVYPVTIEPHIQRNPEGVIVLEYETYGLVKSSDGEKLWEESKYYLGTAGAHGNHKSVVYDGMDDTQVAVVSNYYYGLLHGPLYEYFDFTGAFSGDMKMQTNYHLGLEHGTRITYFRSGEVNAVNNYYLGKMHGKQTTYDKQGNITFESNYHYGERHGKHMYTLDSGVKEILQFSNGEKVGVTYRYRADGSFWGVFK